MTSLRKPTKSAVLYARFSPRPNAEECESVERQIEDMKAWCDQHKVTIRSIHHDKAISGAETDRPGLEEAIAAVKRGDILLVRSLDRLARSVRLFQDIDMRVAMKGGFLSTTDGMDGENQSAETELAKNIKVAVDAYQRRKIRENTSRGMLRRQANGECMSRRIPYGFRMKPQEVPLPDGTVKIKRRLVPHGPEQAVIVRVCSLFDEGKGLREICRILEALCIPCREGETWRHNLVRRILERAGKLEPRRKKF